MKPIPNGYFCGFPPFTISPGRASPLAVLGHLGVIPVYFSQMTGYDPQLPFAVSPCTS